MPLETETEATRTIPEGSRPLPEGFGGRTSTTWPAKWKSGQTAPIRLPKLLHDSLTELARQADQQADPIAWLQSLRPAQETAMEEGEWAGYNVARLRQLARERGLKTARNANRAELLEFLKTRTG